MHHVYFIQRARDKAVKIGVAKDPVARLKQLQTGSSEQLKIVATLPCPGRAQAFDLERDIHKKYANARLVGEWFSPTAMRSLFTKAAEADPKAAEQEDIGRVVRVGEVFERRVRKLVAERNAAREWGEYWYARAKTLEVELDKLRGGIEDINSA